MRQSAAMGEGMAERALGLSSGRSSEASASSEIERLKGELALSELRRELLEAAAADAVWEWDAQTDTIFWRGDSGALAGGSGGLEGEPVGAWADRIHPEDRERALAGARAAMEGQGLVWSDEYRFRRPDGSYAWVAARAAMLRGPDGRARRMAGVMTDKSQERRSREESRRANRALSLRSSVSREVVRAKSERELLGEACEIARGAGGYSLAWVGYAVDGPGRPIEVIACSGEPKHVAYLKALELTWDADKERGQGPAGRAIREGKPLAVDDLSQDPGFKSWAESARAHGYKGAAALPLMEAGKAFGVMLLVSSEGLPGAEGELDLLQSIADDLSFGIGALRAQKETERLHEAVLKVAAGVSGRVGAEFFERLARDLAEAVGAQCATVSKLLPGSMERARMLAVVSRGEALPLEDCSVKGAPMEGALRQGALTIHDGLSKDYPQTLFAEAGARAYMGQRLNDAAGGALGALCVAFAQPIKNEHLVRSTLKIFAARAAAEIERQGSDALIREQASFLDKAQDAIIARAADGRVLFWNKGAERLYGWSSEEAAGRGLKELLYAAPEAFLEANERTLQGGEWSGELSQRKRDGSPVTVEAHWTRVLDASGDPSSILEINTDITHRKVAQKEIQSLAYFDTLTGLPNRLLLLENLQSALERSCQTGHRGALLFIDLDHFKNLNDTLGHEKGDALLREIAQRLRGCVEQPHTLARLGGDEFVAVLEGLPEEGDQAEAMAMAVAERALLEIARPFMLDEYEGATSASMGVAMFSAQDQSVGELLKRADVAMYQSKGSGRNAIRMFDPKMQSAISERAELEADLRQGLRQGQIELHFQPQVSQSGRVTGAEALARWRHPARGMVSPADFIPLAEDTGLILPLGHRVIELACERLAIWASSEETKYLDLAVNVSMRQFRHPDFVAQVAAVIDQFGVNPRRLKLEITESLLADNVEDTIVKMETLKARGVCFSLDDFGTGYSSLSYLKRLPLDQLKIDQSFVRDVLTDPNDAAIAKTIVALGKSLGLGVIAEGVETEDQRQFLEDNGCSAYQGYLFSRPMPADLFSMYLLNWADRRAGG